MSTGFSCISTLHREPARAGLCSDPDLVQFCHKGNDQPLFLTQPRAIPACLSTQSSYAFPGQKIIKARTPSEDWMKCVLFMLWSCKVHQVNQTEKRKVCVESCRITFHVVVMHFKTLRIRSRPSGLNAGTLYSYLYIKSFRCRFLFVNKPEKRCWHSRDWWIKRQQSNMICTYKWQKKILNISKCLPRWNLSLFNVLIIRLWY